MNGYHNDGIRQLAARTAGCNPHPLLLLLLGGALQQTWPLQLMLPNHAIITTTLQSHMQPLLAGDWPQLATADHGERIS